MDSIDKLTTEKFVAFAKEQNPTRVYEALEMIEVAEQNISSWSVQTRKQAISHRLSFLAELNQAIDPHWVPNKLPVKGTTPPPTSGVVYSSGEVDPSTIQDPTTRTEYEQLLKASKEYAKWWDVQFQLRRIDERAIRFLELLLKERYTTSPKDRQEFEALLTASHLTDKDKERIRVFFPR